MDFPRRDRKIPVFNSVYNQAKCTGSFQFLEKFATAITYRCTAKAVIVHTMHASQVYVAFCFIINCIRLISINYLEKLKHFKKYHIAL